MKEAAFSRLFYQVNDAVHLNQRLAPSFYIWFHLNKQDKGYKNNDSSLRFGYFANESTPTQPGRCNIYVYIP